MCIVQRLGALVDNLYDVIDAQQVVGPAVGGQRTGTLNVFGDDVILAVFLARVVNRHDVRVLQHTDHVRFVIEHLARDLGAIGIGIFLDVVDLDRNVAAVIRIVGKKDIARAALADLVDNDVLTDFRRHVILAYGF